MSSHLRLPSHYMLMLRTSMSCRSFRPFLTAILVLLPVLACAPLPPEDPPFEDALASFTTGTTLREEVVSAIGAPTVTLREGKLVAYSQEQFLGGFLVLAEGAGIGVYHLLVISYDDQGFIDNIEKRTSEAISYSYFVPADFCIPSGESFRVFSAVGSIYTKREPPIVVFATQEEDELAKNFDSAEGRCPIYLYYEPRDQGMRFHVIVDGRDLGQSSGDGYVRHEIDPGRHEISTGRYDAESISFECVSREVLFLKLYKRGWFSGFDFVLADKNEAQASVLDRKLVLLE